MRKIEFNSIQFIIGQSAIDNWNIFKEAKAINDNYIWFHLNSFSSPYVIMYASLDDIKNDPSLNYIDFLNYGANLCKQYSKYTFLKDLKIIYTSLKKLTLSETCGEVIISGKTQIIKL